MFARTLEVIEELVRATDLKFDMCKNLVYEHLYSSARKVACDMLSIFAKKIIR